MGRSVIAPLPGAAGLSHVSRYIRIPDIQIRSEHVVGYGVVPRLFGRDDIITAGTLYPARLKDEPLLPHPRPEAATHVPVLIHKEEGPWRHPEDASQAIRGLLAQSGKQIPHEDRIFDDETMVCGDVGSTGLTDDQVAGERVASERWKSRARLRRPASTHQQRRNYTDEQCKLTALGWSCARHVA
jgi:hypothetical protein